VNERKEAIRTIALRIEEKYAEHLRVRLAAIEAARQYLESKDALDKLAEPVEVIGGTAIML
jgi:hypothetical protein